MGILQQFFQNVFQQSPAYRGYGLRPAADSPDGERGAETGAPSDFQLTAAVRPSRAGDVMLRQGYRHDVYRDEETGRTIPVIMASASGEILFPLFIQLVQRLGTSVDVVLESSHDHSNTGHIDFYREQIDMPVLTSVLWDYEDLLVNDGCTGIAVLNPETPQEIQFDEHKLLLIYGSPLEPFEHLLEQAGVHCLSDISFVTEAEHVHTSSQAYLDEFGRLRTHLGIDADYGSTNMC